MSNFNSAPKRVPALHGAEFSARADAMQREANELFGLYGRSADAPRSGETDEGYMRRILSSAARYSKVFSSTDFTDLRKVRADSLPSAWKIIVNDGVEAFKRPEGPLRQAVRTDRTGRETISFYGDEHAVWSQFANEDKFVRINTAMCTGKNAPGAVKPVSVTLSNGSVQAAR
jgi:hypothetical protein